MFPKAFHHFKGQAPHFKNDQASWVCQHSNNQPANLMLYTSKNNKSK